MYTDRRGPEIRIAVHGRELSFLDYAAKDKPFSIFFDDPSGIDPYSIGVTLNGDTLDTTQFSPVSRTDDLFALMMTAYPPKQNRIDSLRITGVDLAGNRTMKTVAYMPGEELSITFLSCHPNPFTARQNRGETISEIRIAFLLTDVAEEVSLEIFSIAGRGVRKWSFQDIIGYQEVPWDGKTASGFRIANGTYYLKLVARNEYRRVKKIIRIAKLEGYK
jgi:hypothetical protein